MYSGKTSSLNIVKLTENKNFCIMQKFLSFGLNYSEALSHEKIKTITEATTKIFKRPFTICPT